MMAQDSIYHTEVLVLVEFSSYCVFSVTFVLAGKNECCIRCGCVPGGYERNHETRSSTKLGLYRAITIVEQSVLMMTWKDLKCGGHSPDNKQ